jgi:radical SAM superfamily enzyme YgiQ (UPF0313 family)/cyclophilin family peptidyl-prolyl cis-trans isomerase
LFLLASYLAKHNRDVRTTVLDLTIELPTPTTATDARTFLHQAELLLAEQEIDIVGISCWTSQQYVSSVAIAEICKRINPGCVVVVGGHHPTALPEDFVYEGSPFDYIVCGEGELALSDLLRRKLAVCSPPEVIQGKPLTDLEDCELEFEKDRYVAVSKAYWISVSRGCPFRCAFCTESVCASQWRAMRPSHALNMIQKLVDLGMTDVFLFDALFGFSSVWRKEFLRGVARRFPDLAIWAETRPDILDSSDIELLATTGMRLDLGLDAATPASVERMKKASDPTKYLERFVYIDNLMNRHKLGHRAYLIWNYPGSTVEEIDLTVKFIKDLIEPRDENFTSVRGNPFFLFPGTEVYRNLSAYRQRFGFRHGAPNWWKLKDRDYCASAQQCISSADVVKNGKLFYHREARQMVTEASARKMSTATFLKTNTPVGPPQLRDHILENFRLRIRPSIHRYDSGNSIALFLLGNMDSGTRLMPFLRVGSDLVASVSFDRRSAGWIIDRLYEGATLDGLAQNGGFRREVVKDLIINELNKRGMLEVVEPSPWETATKGIHASVATLYTDSLEVVIDLNPSRTPKTVANFASLAERGFYDECAFFHLPTYHAIGFGSPSLVSLPGANAGYVFDNEITPSEPHEPGDVFMYGEYAHMNGTRVGICLRKGNYIQEQNVAFGRVNNLSVLGKLIIGNRIVKVRVGPQ